MICGVDVGTFQLSGWVWGREAVVFSRRILEFWRNTHKGGLLCLAYESMVLQDLTALV